MAVAVLVARLRRCRAARVRAAPAAAVAFAVLVATYSRCRAVWVCAALAATVAYATTAFASL